MKTSNCLIAQRDASGQKSATEGLTFLLSLGLLLIVLGVVRPGEIGRKGKKTGRRVGWNI